MFRNGIKKIIITYIYFRQVRCSAAEQFIFIVKFSWSAKPLLSTIFLMFSVLNDTVLKFAQNSFEYFHVSYYNIYLFISLRG